MKSCKTCAWYCDGKIPECMSEDSCFDFEFYEPIETNEVIESEEVQA